jgi:hypothetical protein
MTSSRDANAARHTDPDRRDRRLPPQDQQDETPIFDRTVRDTNFQVAPPAPEQ